MVLFPIPIIKWTLILSIRLLLFPFMAIYGIILFSTESYQDNSWEPLLGKDGVMKLFSREYWIDDW